MALHGGAVAGWPFITRAQEGRPVRLVGILGFTSRGDGPAIMSETAAFKEALQRLGWGEGRNIRFEGRFNVSDSETRRKLAKELVALKGRRDPHIRHSADSGSLCRDPHDPYTLRERIRPNWKWLCSESRAS